MTYLNVSLSGLRGRRHPALSELVTTGEVKGARIHIKMLAGDYFTYDVKANQSGGSPHCMCCSPLSPNNEDLLHILTICDSFADIKKQIFPVFQSLCLQANSTVDFSEISSENSTLCQFILDLASFNLKTRIHI